MVAPGKLMAAFAGLAVSFVFVMFLQVVSPPPGLETDEATLRFERLQFGHERMEFTRGASLRVENEAGIPVAIAVSAPDGDNVTFLLAAGGTKTIALGQEGRYAVEAPDWPWAKAELVVASANPFERFVDDLF